jgi:hypothetical protein
MLGLVPTSDYQYAALNRNSRCKALVRAVVTIGLVHNVATLREEQQGKGPGPVGPGETAEQAQPVRRVTGAVPQVLIQFSHLVTNQFAGMVPRGGRQALGHRLATRRHPRGKYIAQGILKLPTLHFPDSQLDGPAKT